MPWYNAAELIPRDGEKILFHCKNWMRKSTWEVGRYDKNENRVYNHYVGRVYEFYDWDQVDYWFHVTLPPTTTQTDKKTNAA